MLLQKDLRNIHQRGHNMHIIALLRRTSVSQAPRMFKSVHQGNQVLYIEPTFSMVSQSGKRAVAAQVANWKSSLNSDAISNQLLLDSKH
jgi:hypothetical protein